MRQLGSLFSLLALMTSCQTTGYESYNLSWIGWALIFSVVLALFFILVLKKGVVDEEDEIENSISTSTYNNVFIPIGSYIGGHPQADKVIDTIVFRKNNEYCLLFAKDLPFSIPEVKFKISIGSINNINVENLHSISKKIALGMIILPATGMNAIKRMENNKPSFVIIDWTDVYGVHSCVFSFEGNDSVQNAMNARNRFLQTLKPLKSVRF